MVSNMSDLVMTQFCCIFVLFFIVLFKTWNVGVPIVRK